ncbi:Lipoprotein [Pseudomonas sp. IT-P44]
MTKTMTFFVLALLVGCSTHKPEPPLLPRGNMPMTEQEYQEAELLLLKKQELPPDECAK